MRIASSLLGPADPASDVEAGDVRQADVEDDDVDARCVLGDRGARLAVVGDVDYVAVFLEQSLEDPGEAFIVLDDEDVHPAVSFRYSRIVTTVSAVATRSRLVIIGRRLWELLRSG